MTHLPAGAGSEVNLSRLLPPHRQRRTTVVELDHVLIRTAVSATLANRHPGRRRREVQLLHRVLQLAPIPLWQEWRSHRHTASNSFSAPLEQVHASVIDVLSTGMVRWTAVALVNEAILAGERVLVCTALDPVFARALLDTLGLHQAEVYELATPGGREKRRQHGQALATLLAPADERTNPSLTRLFVSFVDPTLAEAGAQIMLVNPTSAAAERAREVPGVRVVRWPEAEPPAVIAAAFGLPV